MPCYDGIGDAIQKQETFELRESVGFLCALCRKTESLPVFAEVEGLKRWWEDHQIIDALNDFYEAHRKDEYPMKDALCVARGYGGMREFIRDYPEWCWEVFKQHKLQTKNKA
jgi:hypothetical protein